MNANLAENHSRFDPQSGECHAQMFLPVTLDDHEERPIVALSLALDQLTHTLRCIQLDAAGARILTEGDVCVLYDGGDIPARGVLRSPDRGLVISLPTGVLDGRLHMLDGDGIVRTLGSRLLLPIGDCSPAQLLAHWDGETGEPLYSKGACREGRVVPFGTPGPMAMGAL